MRSDNLFPRLRSFVTTSIFRQHFEDSLDEEVRFHLDTQNETAAVRDARGALAAVTILVMLAGMAMPTQVQALNAPMNLRATEIGRTYVVLAWDAPTDLSNYVATELLQSPYVSLQPILSTNDASIITYRATGLTPGTTYRFVVDVYDTGDFNHQSNRITVTTKALPSTDATLTSLGLRGATLSKTFRPAGENYRTNLVANSVTEIRLAPTTSDASASLKVLDANDTEMFAGGPNLDYRARLVDGDNVITVVVTAEDGITTKTYTVAVLRAVATPEEELGCGSSSNPCTVTANGDNFYGAIDPAGEEDWMAVELNAGTTYSINVHKGEQLGLEKLRCRTLDVYAPNGTRVGGAKSGLGGISSPRPITHRFTPSTGGAYKLKVGGSCYRAGDSAYNHHLDTGYYKVTVLTSAAPRSVSETSTTGDLPATTATTGVLTPAGAVTGTLSSGTDSDWYRMQATSSNSYRFPTEGLEYVVVMDERGDHVWDNERSFRFGGEDFFRPSVSGTYYIAANSWRGRENYGYRIEMGDSTRADDGATAQRVI